MSFFARAGRRLTTTASANIGFAAHPQISTYNSRFTLMDAARASSLWPQPTLPVIVLWTNPNVSKIYYDAPFNRENPAPPACWSDNGVAPSIGASNRQARTCAECPHNAFGSKEGSRGKACSDRKKLAVLVVGGPDKQVYELSIPPASLSRWATYCRLVESHSLPDSSRPADLCDVVTCVGFDANSLGALTFEVSHWIDEVHYDHGMLKLMEDGSPDGGKGVVELMDSLWSNEAMLNEIVGANDQPYGLPAPTAAKPLPPSPIQTPVAALTAPPPEPPQELPRHPLAGPPGLPVSQPVRAISEPAKGPERRGGPRPGAGRPRTKELPGMPDTPAALKQAGLVTNPPAPSTQMSDALKAAFNLPTK